MKQLDTKLMHPAEQIKVIIGRIYRSGMTTTSGGNVSIMDDNGDMWITCLLYTSPSPRDA